MSPNTRRTGLIASFALSCRWLLPVLFLGMVTASAVAGPAAPQRKAPLLDGATRLANWERHEAMKETSRFRDLEWEFIGPEIMSGRVTDIAVPKGSRWTMYVATASGGVWKTENEGTTWEPIFENAPSQSTGAIAISPSSPDQIWVGLGEANIFRSSMSGAGIWFSPDAGRSWEYKGLADTQQVARIVVHPTDPNTVWVAAAGNEWTWSEERGVYKTTDGGATWEKTLYVDEKTGVYDLRIDPRDPNTLYAATWERIRLKWSDPKPGAGTSIYKSTDGGDSWREIDNGLPADRSKRGRIGIDIARTNPQVLYASIDNHETARAAEEGERDAYGRERSDVIKGAEVYKTTDGGATWEKWSESSQVVARNNATYGWVFGQIRVDPTDEDTLYIMGLGILRSIDGGREFQRLNYAGLHGDHHAMWIDPEDGNHIINGNDGGINISYDGGQTWKNIDNHPVVQFYNIGYDMQEPFWVYGSIQDNGSWKAPVYLRSRQLEEMARSGGQRGGRGGRGPRVQSSIRMWEGAPGGEDSYHQIDPFDPNIVYSAGFYGNIARTINGVTERLRPADPDDGPPLRGQWLAPFTLSPHNPKVIYHGMNMLFRSMDRGDRWEAISPDLTYNDPAKIGDIPYQTITAIAESPLKFGRLYVGTDDGRSWTTPDGGETWNEMTDKVAGGVWVSRFEASRFAECTAYTTHTGKRDNDFRIYAFKTTDCGETWTDISDGIPGGPANVIREDPTNPDILYLGTDLGVYVSLDGGSSWGVVANGLPNTFVHDLIIHPRDRIMVIATHGRGMYAMDAIPIQEMGR